MFDFDLFSKREWAAMVVAFLAVTALSLYGLFSFLDYLTPHLGAMNYG
ncbi:hypothetical protein RAD16_39990 [Bradyrhizobium sp. 18BD]